MTAQLVNRVGTVLVIGWSLAVAAVGLVHAYGNKRLAVNSALVEARTLVKQEELSRLWVAQQVSPDRSEAGKAGGLRFSHIDITRQVYHQLERDDGYHAHLVRIDSQRDNGQPDAWELQALRRMEDGGEAQHDIFRSGKAESLRLIYPLRVSEECTSCHTGDYRTGDLLGGFSLTIPLAPYYEALGVYNYAILIGYLMIWSIGLLLTRMAMSLFKRQLDDVRSKENQLQLAETSLHYYSYFDPETNLPNRATFDDRLRVAMAHAERKEERVAVAVVNVENFTQIRNLFSRGIGDQLLKTVAEIVALRIRPDDTIARMGVDRLLLLLPGLVSRENVARIVNNINEGFDSPLQLDGSEVQVEISFGVAVYPDDTQTPDSLVAYAETAASRVSQQKFSNLQMYSESLNAAAHTQLQLETGLRQGLNRNEFCIHYQPQIDAPSGTIIGAEALIRWNHPELGMIPPDRFIPMAENNGAIVPIGEWILLDACRQAVHWQKTHDIDFRIGVNVSARQFQGSALTDVVDRVLAETGIDPAQLEIEVTEGAIIENIDQAIETLVDLKVRGVKVAIDDFGVGYSSLSQLKRLPFDRLKVDRSFIADIEDDRDSQVIVEMLIDLAVKLNMEIIAEGVETEEQRKFLIARGCYPMQGYYFSRPLPAEEFSRLLEERYGR